MAEALRMVMIHDGPCDYTAGLLKAPHGHLLRDDGSMGPVTVSRAEAERMIDAGLWRRVADTNGQGPPPERRAKPAVKEHRAPGEYKLCPTCGGYGYVLEGLALPVCPTCRGSRLIQASASSTTPTTAPELSGGDGPRTREQHRGEGEPPASGAEPYDQQEREGVD